MGLGDGLSTQVGSNWLHAVAMTLNTKQNKIKQNKQTVRVRKSWARNDASPVTAHTQFAHKAKGEIQCSKKYTFT